jgi:type IV pilus assembly protein PilB
MAEPAEFLIAALQEDGQVKPEGVARARVIASEQGVSLEDALVLAGLTTHEQIAITRAVLAEVPYVRLSDYSIDIRSARSFPRALAERHAAFPLFVMDQVTTVGMADPQDLSALDQIRRALKTDIEPVVCEPAVLRDLISRAYSLSQEDEAAPSGDAATEALVTGEEPIVVAVNQIVAQAMAENASDVHISPDEHELHLRLRVDGLLRSHPAPSRSLHAGIVQRIKVMARMDLTQTRRPQDGKFRFTHRGRSVDIRASVLPTVHGENVVLRLLATGASIKGFAELGIGPDLSAQIEHLLEHPHGMFLVTGPTGSGKTTTLYTCLKRLNDPAVNLMTIEDPVEIRLPMVRQVQVNTEIGMTFAGALRAMLRQDPDVVLIGEVRDDETARIAVQAALTGHMVLSTLHTNDAAGAVARLRDLGCPAFGINAALLGVLAQRLVRRVCQFCTLPWEPEAMTLARFGLPPTENGFVAGGGCSSCGGSGYKGRLTIAELLTLTPALRAMVERGEGAGPVRAAAVRAGMKPMWRDGVDKARVGLTSLDELGRVVCAEPEDLAASPEPGAHREAA